VDFDEQVTTNDGRPDMIIRLPDFGILPVDAKTPMTAFLSAIEAIDDNTRKSKLDEHAKALRSRVRNLSKNPYSKQFDKAPEFVVMFIPNEACLSAAFDQDAELFEFAIQQRVLITTPVTLLALLKAAGYGWQQYQMATNVRQIAEQGKQMYDRLSVFVRHLNDVGHKLNQAVEQYNEAVGSLESRVLPSAMRFRELGATSAELPEPKGIEHRARLSRHVELDVEHV
jgi:DNA recombination protein RmuC